VKNKKDHSFFFFSALTFFLSAYREKVAEQRERGEGENDLYSIIENDRCDIDETDRILSQLVGTSKVFTRSQSPWERQPTSRIQQWRLQKTSPNFMRLLGHHRISRLKSLLFPCFATDQQLADAWL
jgi:hypothetical protein